MPPSARSRGSDLGAIERNCAALRARLGGAALCAVVKADGYGHGAVPSARAALAGGATWIAVATAREAAELREGGIEERVLVMGALTNADLELAVWGSRRRRRLDTPSSPRSPRPERVGVHVKLDTGMGRLGTADPDEARALVDRLASAGVFAGLMTHFATADERGDEHFPAQLERFRALAEHVRDEHPDAVVHAANSAATLRDAAAHFDMVRCGVAVYGLDPFQRDPAREGLEPAMTLESYVASVKRFEPGASAGYGRTWSAGEPTWVGVLPIGYGDGWRRGSPTMRACS